MILNLRSQLQVYHARQPLHQLHDSSDFTTTLTSEFLLLKASFVWLSSWSENWKLCDHTSSILWLRFVIAISKLQDSYTCVNGYTIFAKINFIRDLAVRIYRTDRQTDGRTDCTVIGPYCVYSVGLYIFTFTWPSDMPSPYASRVRSGPARYFVCSKVFSSVKIWCPENVGRVCFLLVATECSSRIVGDCWNPATDGATPAVSDPYTHIGSMAQ